MSLVSFLVSILKLAPSSRLLQLSIRSSFAEVSGLGSGLDSEPGSKLPFATLVDQIKPGSIDANPLNLASCIDSEPGSELPFGTPVDQTEVLLDGMASARGHVNCNCGCSCSCKL